MRQDVLVYLAGPISPTKYASTEVHIARALDTFLQLTQAGVPSFLPHATAAFPSAHKIDYDVWMAWSDTYLRRCTHVLMLPGWTTSKGAMLEFGRAKDRGVPIVQSVEELFQLLGM